MGLEDLVRCQIQEWYPVFKSHTFLTFFHPLPQPFLRYLRGQSIQEDDHNDQHAPPPLFVLPRSTTGRDPLPRTTSRLDPVSLLDPDLSNLSDDDDEDDQDAPCFPDLEAAVERSISDLGGAAFPKLNWSAPKDATWISPDGSLRCSSFADVALLLRSSDSIAHDLSHDLSHNDDADQSNDTDSTPNVPQIYYLALREWDPSLRPEMEFRCFVRRRRRLVAVSQRDVTAFYPAILDRRLEISDAIRTFFSDVVGPLFGSEEYTFDVCYYVSKRRGRGKVKLVDFNPWGGFTLPLLFSWEELEEDEEEDGEVEFRVVESQCGVRPGLKTAVPYDYLDTGEGSGWDQFLRKADEELRQQAQHADAGCS